MTEWVEQWTCIRFCIKLEHSSIEILQMILKATALGNWWLEASSWQHSCSGITSPAEFFWWNIKSLGDSAPKEPRFGALGLLTFPQTKITFERGEISDHWWDSGKYDGADDGDWENCVRSQGLAYLEGNWGIIVICTVFLVSLINFSSFHSTLLDTFWTGLVYWVGPKVHLFSSVRRR